LFDGTVNTTEILDMWLLPQLRESGLREDMSLQDGVAPANFICSIVLFYFLRVGGGGGGEVSFCRILNMIGFMNK